MNLLGQVLRASEQTMSAVAHIDALAAKGDEAGALRSLRLLAREVEPVVPILRGVAQAQHQAAEAFDLTQSRAVRVIASIGVPQEHPHAANAHSPPPEQPAPSLA